MKEIEVIVEHAGNNLSAYIENVPVVTVGDSLQEKKDNMREAIDLYMEDTPHPCEALQWEYELKYKLDAATFIKYYSSSSPKRH